MQPQPPGRHVPALDGARGIAILLVVLVHAYARPGGGFLGVEVFFVLSGFLITTLLLREHERTRRISLSRFFQRRALRLLPAFAAFLIGYAVVTAVAMSAAGGPWNARAQIGVPVLESIFYVSNLAQAFHGVLPPGIRQLWSLAAEEQFYLLWPLALVVLLRRRTPPAALARMLIAGIAAVAVLRFSLDVAGVDRIRLYFAPTTSCDALLAGCLFAVWFVHGTGARILRSPDFRRVAVPLVLAGAAAQVALMDSWTNPLLYRWVMLPFALECGFLLFAVATDATSLLSRALACRPLCYLGRISYGLYLWHPLVLWARFSGLLPRVSLTATEAVALALVIAILSYNLVEQPFLRRKQRLAGSTLSPPEEERPDEPRPGFPTRVAAVRPG
jgi:peptidoglycan/LPS O-acetylase OafA/YrhL